MSELIEIKILEQEGILEARNYQVDPYEVFVEGIRLSEYLAAYRIQGRRSGVIA